MISSIRLRAASAAVFVLAIASHASADWQTVQKPSGETVRLCSGRQFHTSTLIGTNADFAGQVLIIGGLDGTRQPTAAVELFDPATGTVRQCHSLAEPRYHHTATWVRVGTGPTAKGRVLVVGGYSSCVSSPCEPGELRALNTYELYDPSADCSSPPTCSGCDCPPGNDVATPLPGGVPRAEHSATVLSSNLDEGGIVLIAGGTAERASVLFFDPTTSWIPANPLFQLDPRFGHTASYVRQSEQADPKSAIVFLVGGSARPGAAQPVVTSDVILRPLGGDTRIIDTSASPNELRPAHSHTASLVAPDRLLIWGGDDESEPSLVDFAPYFENAGMRDPDRKPAKLSSSVNPTRRSIGVDTLAFPSLRGALFVGGIQRNECRASVETTYFSGQSASWNGRAGSLVTPRAHHTVTPLAGGKSIVAIGGVVLDSLCRQERPVNTLEVLDVGTPGRPCSRNDDCITDHCEDGVCCDRACPSGPGSGTECQTCKTGQCMASAAGTACGPAACGQSPVCDGEHRACPGVDAGTCEAPPDGGPDGDTGTGDEVPDELRPTLLSCECSQSFGSGSNWPGCFALAGSFLLVARRIGRRRCAGQSTKERS